ncbi:MAG: RNA polymerase sigma factor [Oscillospiraceae bacterium]|nr:RNA polymerase sigma factor [Oscillospiraceae bacterium]
MGIDAKKQMQLIRMVQKNGNRAAADTLISEYYDEIYVYAARQTGDKHIAMDLTQNIFVSMLQTIARYDSKRAGFRTWLYRIATNKIIDYHRSRSTMKNKALNIDDIEVAREDELTEWIENEDLAAQILKHIAEFDSDIQRIFRLKIYAQQTFAEIADDLNLPEATVKTKYYRTIKALRKEFADEYYA